jgi:hypothetical protein
MRSVSTLRGGSMRAQARSASFPAVTSEFGVSVVPDDQACLGALVPSATGPAATIPIWLEAPGANPRSQ